MTETSSPSQRRMPNLFKRRRSLNNSYIAVRHGHAHSNQKGILVCSEVTDGPEYGLTDTGNAQIAASTASWKTESRYADLLRAGNVIILSSPRVRARESAAIIQSSLLKEFGIEPPIEIRNELNERGFGDRDGKSDLLWNEIAEADLADAFSSFENSESVYQMYLRLNALLVDLEERFRGETFILVSHCDPIQVLEALFTMAEPAHYSEIPAFANAESRILSLVSCHDSM